ncbi:MAG TPA: hypothetical protein VL993_15365 [Stellaceae bacterium]|nr:hypothetical protein [Stellaceae bacterium]
MKIVQGEELQWQRGLEHRGGIFHNRLLMEGEPGTVDNFQLSMGRMGGAFFSPRHRHNFEQIRFQLDGELDFARDGRMKTGMVGYFPEGMFYGPQSQDPEGTPITIVLQMGGASGSGYLSRAEVKAGMDALQPEGEFKDGVFRRHKDVPGKRNVDGYQAIWEHVNKRPLAYPKPRYSRPFMMDPTHYEWLASADELGVAEKLMGVFTERRSTARFLRLDPGATHRASGRSLYFVIEGAGTVEGEPLQNLTTVYLRRGEQATFTAREETRMLHLGMPDLTGVASQGAGVTAAAAE